MFIIKVPVATVKRLATSRRWRTVIFVSAGTAVLATRARTVISAAPRRSKAAVQGLTADVRTMFGKEQQAIQQAASSGESASSSEMPAPSSTGATGTPRPATESASVDRANATPTNQQADAATNIPGQQPTGATTAPAPPETDPAGEDKSGEFHPTQAETDDFGVVVTDSEPAGLDAAEDWVKGDGTATCPDGFPIKGNANSRIYHRPGEPSYEQTIPELCFANEEAAQRSGFRARKS